MNKIYKVIWSKVKHQYVVVSELAHRDGKRSSTATTSKATWRALAAALMLTGSLAAMPYTGYAATGAETTSGQYIAVAVDSNNNSYKTGWWGHQETHYYKAGDTRTFEDANGDEHEYTWVSVDGKDYWVREGYSITIAESNRFDAYDENNNHIAPDKSYVIDSQKGENADDSGLISSSQVLVTDDKKHTTLTGNELNKIDAGIYGGAVNTGGTQVPVDYHYYIDDNGNGYINVGKKDNWSDFENSGHFKRVYYNEEKGVYQTTDGITVSSEYLYAIDGTSTGRQDQGIASDVELGAFFNSDGTVYTGKVYGHNNEVLMTGYDEATDKYYSYWGTQISDRKMSLANLTVGNLLDIKDGLEGSIYTAQGDDIKQVSVQKAQGSNNGGTIGFIRRGDYVGDDAEGNPIYKDTAPVPGTITIRNTDNSGKEGNDVAIRFGTIDEHGQDVQKFTVDAGSKVEGKIGESIATVDDKGQTLDGISINGVDYKLGGGQNYTAGTNVDITNNAISTNDYRLVGSGKDGTGSYAPDENGEITLQVKDNKTGDIKNVTLTDIASAEDVTTNATNIGILQEADKLNVKYDSPAKDSVTLGGTGAANAVKLTNVANGVNPSDAVNFSQLSEVKNAEDYVTGGSINNETGTITLNRQLGGKVEVSGLKTYISNNDEYATSASLEGNTLTINRHLGEAITVDLSELTSGMSATDYRLIGSGEDGTGSYAPDKNGDITLQVKDNKTGDVKNVTLTDIASAEDVTMNTTNIGILQEADKLNVKYDSPAKDSVTLGGTGAAAVKLTNVANGENPSDAVNFSQLSEVKNAEDYVTGGSINNETGTITLNRQLGGKVEVSGLKTYISNNDEYATSASLEGNTLTINRHLGEAITVDLSELTSGMSATDYRLIGSGEKGTGSYAPDENGEITLQVKDNKTGDIKNVTLTDIASAEDVTTNATNIGILQEADKLNVKYDSPAKDSVTLGGTGAANAVKLTNVANGVNPFDAVNFSQLSEVKGEAGKHTTIEPTGTNITVTQNSAEGEALNYTVDLNPVVTLDGTAGDDKQIVLDGNNGTISAENSNTTGHINKTTTDNTFDFDENGGTFTTTETTTSLGGIVQKGTMKHEATFDGDGATFTKSALSLSEGSENSSTNIDGGTVTVQGDEIFGLGLTNKTVIDGGTITVTGSGLTGGRTVIDGKKITAGDIKVNNESRATITGLSNQTINYAGFGGGRAATEAQLKLMQDQISDDLKVTASDGIAINDKNEVSVNYGDGLTLSETKDETTGTKKLQVKGGDGVTVDGNGVSVKVGSNLEINDDNQVDLRKNVDLGADGSLKVGGVVTLDKTGAAIGSVKVNAETSTVDGLANKEWTKEISDAIANKYTDAMGRAASQGQLYDVAEIANNAYTEAGKHTTMTVNNGMAAPEDDNYTTDGNLQLKQTNTDGQIKYDVKLNDDIVLSGSGESAEEQDNRVTLSGTNGTIMATTNFDDMSATTTINGGNVYVGSSVSVGDTVVMTDKDITGLSNTTWNGQTNDVSRAATEGQLQMVSDTVASGWTATDDNGNKINVNPNTHPTLNFASGKNVTVNAENDEINVALNDDIVLGGSGESAEEQDNRVTLSGTNGTIMATTNFDDMSATTTINGGNVYVGSSVSVGDTVVMTDKDITGLSNTTWDGETDDVSRAATEGQLKAVSDNVNAGWIATDDNGNEITVNPKDNTLNFSGDRNVTVEANKEDGSIDVSLNDDIVLGGKDGSTSRVQIGGTDGVITVTKDADDMGATTTIAGGDIYAGSSVTVGDTVKLTAKDITGLSNTTWDGTTDDVSRAATEGQLQTVSDKVNSGWTATDDAGNKINVNPTNSTLNFASGKNVTVSAVTEKDEISVDLNDNLLLGSQDGSESSIAVNGTDGSIILNSVSESGSNSIEINAAQGTITGLTNAIGEGKDGWETFTDKDTVHGSRAVTEDDLYEVYRHGVQYSVNDDGTPDYTTIVLGNPYNANTKGGGTRITNVAYATGENGSEAVNVDYLKDQISNATTTVTANEKHIATNDGPNPDVAGGQFSVKDGKITLVEVNGNGETTGNTVVIDNVASASDLGDVTQIHDGLMNKDENGNNVDTSVVDAVNNLDDKVGSGDFTGTTHITNPGDTNLTDAIKDLDSAITNAQTEAGKHSTVSTVDGDKNIIVNDINTDPSKGANYQISLNKDLNVDTVTASGNIDAGSFSSGNITINKDNSGTINGLSNKTWDAAKDYSDSGMAATEAQLQKATEGAVQYDRNEDGTVNKESITLGGSTYDPETHKGGTTITNVADGQNASDAVNMSQLWQTNQAVINNSNNISMLSNSVNKLDNRIDRVGAGAAALAALHPLDFDPDAKWDFAAGYGNYRGANAVAVGAYYRPNEDVMFSVGGSMGGGENMVNAGVSLKIGAGSSNVTTSRVAMAKEIKSMRDIVAKQDAQIQKLTAMVNALVGIQSEPDTTTMFPDVPENHWAYEAVEAMAKSGLVKGYPDGEFKGDRTMTRYEFAQIVYNAIQAGAEVDARLVQEFQPELQYFRVDTVAQDKNGNPTIQRVRVNDIPVQQ